MDTNTENRSDESLHGSASSDGVGMNQETLKTGRDLMGEDRPVWTPQAERSFRMSPTVGRSVHFWVMSGGILEPKAAIITQVLSDDVVSLAVFHPTKTAYMLEVKWAEETKENCWSWPARLQ